MTGTIDARQFRQALGSFTTGVTIVTTVDAGGQDVGLTVNSFNSVSLDPPMVLWSIDRNSNHIDAFVAARHFAVHVLTHEQEALASRFATRDVDRFEGLRLERGPDGIPLLPDCAARFQCRTAFQYEGGDHLILVGEVQAFDHGEFEPLVYARGRYARAVHKTEPPAGPDGAGSALDSPDALAPDFLIYQLGRAHHQLVARLQPELDRRGIGLPEYFALSMLGLHDSRRVSELDALVSCTGVRVTGDTAGQLAGLGLVERSSGGDPRLRLSPAGQSAVVELLAAAKAASEDAETGFSPAEARLLRQFLNRLIVATNPHRPHPA